MEQITSFIWLLDSISYLRHVDTPPPDFIPSRSAFQYLVKAVLPALVLKSQSSRLAEKAVFTQAFGSATFSGVLVLSQAYPFSKMQAYSFMLKRIRRICLQLSQDGRCV